MEKVIRNSKKITQQAWDENACFWDEKMGEGNDFFNFLEWPSILRLLNPKPGQSVLDIATGNGLIARKLAALEVNVDAIDFSEKLLGIAEAKPNPGGRINYYNLDVTNERKLLSLGTHKFDSAICNMALFDISDIFPIFTTLPHLLKPSGIFVFTITHPAFNNASCTHMVEEIDEGGKLRTVYSIKISNYMSPTQTFGIAMRTQPKPHIYFDRPLEDYLHPGFENGFVLDGFEENAFPSSYIPSSLLSWGGNFSEIPPVLAIRMRLNK